MPYTYAADQTLLATEMNAIVKTAGIYAADSGAANAYVITLSPIPTSYADGDAYSFKAANTNTSASTINVNSLGATTIKRADGKDLLAGDIVSGKVYRIYYNGSTFTLENILPKFKVITSTKSAGEASTTTTYAHGMGGIPSFVEVDAIHYYSAYVMAISHGAYDGTSNKSIYSSPGATTGSDGSNGSAAINIAGDAGSQIGVITLDATNISVVWTKSGSGFSSSGTGVAQLIFKIFA